MISPVTRKKSFDIHSKSFSFPVPLHLTINILHNKDYAQFECSSHLQMSRSS